MTIVVYFMLDAYTPLLVETITDRNVCGKLMELLCISLDFMSLRSAYLQCSARLYMLQE